MKHRSLARLAVSVGLVTAMTAAMPSIALADEASDLQSQLDAANSQLNELYGQASDISEQVNDAQYQLDQTNAQIEQTKSDIDATQSKLSEAQDTLANRVSSTYKTGGVSLLSILFDSSNFDDLVSRIYYANKVSASDADAIKQVKDLKGQLDQQQADLEAQQQTQQQVADELKSQQSALQGQITKVKDYTNSLSQQVREKLAEQQAAAKAAAEEQARQAQAKADKSGGNYVTDADVKQPSNNSNGGGGSSNSNSGSSNSNSGNSGSNKRPSNNNGGSSNSNGGGSSSNSSGNGSTAARNAVIAAATSKVGCDYVFHATGPNQFDCSGLTMWAFAQVGIDIPHSSGSQSSFCTKPASQAVPGDVVWYPGHVGIYIGGGVTIEAMSPSQGVTYGSLSNFRTAGWPA